MPLRKKNSGVKKIILLALVISLVILMLVYFPPAQNVTEIVLYQ